MPNKYTFFWLTGDRQVLEGNSPEDALNHAGYGAGSIPALDFYADGDNNDYVWIKEEHRWTNKKYVK